jgi:hypothetical protein
MESKEDEFRKEYEEKGKKKQNAEVIEGRSKGRIRRREGKGRRKYGIKRGERMYDKGRRRSSKVSRNVRWSRNCRGNARSSELTAYFIFVRDGPHRKRPLQQFLIASGTCLWSSCETRIHSPVRCSKLLLVLASTVILNPSGRMAYNSGAQQQIQTLTF